MGFYKQREDYLRGLAEGHPLVKHNQPVSVDDDTPRQSFFRINEEAELMAACTNWVHFPCVVHFGLSGGDINKNGSVRQSNANLWMFLDQMVPDQNNPVEATAITEAYDTAFEVMQDFKKSVYNEYEENDGCGIFKNIDPSFFKWEQYGPVGDNIYGWILSFKDETKPNI